MKVFKLIVLFSILSFALNAQKEKNMELPFYNIPEAAEEYTAGNVLSRMIDGLGYRYYWASDSLEQVDLDFKPSEDARSTMETLEHIYGLSKTILNGVKNVNNVRPAKAEEMSYEEVRTATLHILLEASELIRTKSEQEISELKIKFERNGKVSEVQFWNMINGPIADAIYHTGQVVSFRRITGNPMYSGVSVFSGKTK